LQQLRGLECSAAEQDFAGGAHGFVAFGVAVGDADGAFSVKFDVGGVGVGDHGEVGAVHHRKQAGGGRAAFAVFGVAIELRHLIEADALVIAAIEIGGGAVLHFGGGHKGV
jgi:hypothetical protein